MAVSVLSESSRRVRHAGCMSYPGMDTTPQQPRKNRYREALERLERSREQLVNQATDHILDQGEEILEQDYRFQEFLENQGTRLHFLTLLASQIEQSADDWDEAQARESLRAASSKPARKQPAGKPRRRKAVEPAPEGKPGDT